MGDNTYNVSTPTYNATLQVNQTIAEWFIKYENKIVPQSFISGYIVLSYLVSFIGAWTTLELFNQRTGNRGFHNWNILIASSISMGGVAIWCMHFIGNRAIILVEGQIPLQISYNSGFTTLSFFIPILVLLAAFAAVGSNESVSVLRVTFGGSLAGFAICGMHYLGQAGISNYTPIYKIRNVVAAAIIAVFASITALSVFFVLRTSWSGSWWKRGLCAIILGGAVSGMHWVATIGTTYRLRPADWNKINSNSNSRESTTIVVAVLSFTACLVLVIFTIITHMRKTKVRNQAQMVVLASAIFDKDGRILVTTEGNFPNIKITKQYIEHTFEDVFGVSHPVYLWLFRTTRNWPGITALIPTMRNHLALLSDSKSSRPEVKHEIKLTTDTGDPIEDYTVVFRELFCVAAADLAEHLGTTLEDMGVLYDEIISTGQQPRLRKMTVGKSKVSRSPGASIDIERDGLAGFGRGQLLFLVKKADRREGEKFLANGFRFSSLNHVIDILARSMRVEKADLAERLIAMRQYANASNIMEPGVHLACFAIRAHIGGVFDTLVRRDARNQLPTMQLPIGKLEDWQIDYLETLEGKPVSVCLKVMKAKAQSSTTSDREQIWASQLYETLEALRTEIGESYFIDAKLISKPVAAPCRGFGERSRPDTCKLIAFRIIVPINVRKPGPKLEFIPIKFLRMQQHVYPHSPDHHVWERKIYREFYPIMTALAHKKAEGVGPGGLRHSKLSDPPSSDTNSTNDPLVQAGENNFSGSSPKFVLATLKVGNEGMASRTSGWQFWKTKTMPGLPMLRSRNSYQEDDRISKGISPASGILVSSAVSVDVNDKRWAKTRTDSTLDTVEMSTFNIKLNQQKKSGTHHDFSSMRKPGVGVGESAGWGQGVTNDGFGRPIASAAGDDFDSGFGFGGPPMKGLGQAVGMEGNAEGLGTVVEVVREVCDPETFVDELMHVTIDKRNL